MLFYQVYWQYFTSLYHYLAIAYWQLWNTRTCYVIML